MKATTSRPSASSRTTTLHGQQQADVGLRSECTLGQRWVASPQNAIRAALGAELGLHRGLHVDLGQDAEALGRKGLGHPRERLGKVLLRQKVVEAVARGCGSGGAALLIAHGAAPHMVACIAAMRCAIMSIISCIMAE